MFKNKVFIVLGLLIGLVFMSGCNDVEKEFLQKYFSATEWTAIQDVANIDLTFKVEDAIDLDYALNLKSYTESAQDYRNMKSILTISGKSKNDNFKDFPSANIIYDSGKVYVAVKDIVNIIDAFEMPLSGKNRIEFNQHKDAYLVLDYFSFLEEMYAGDPVLSGMYANLANNMYSLEANRNFLTGLAEALPNFTLDMTKEGNTYTMTIDNKNVVALADSLIVNVIENLEQVIEIYPLPEAYKQQMLEEIKNVDKAEILAAYKMMATPEVMAEIQSIIDQGEFKIYMKS